MSINFFNLKDEYRIYKKSLNDALLSVLDSSEFIGGRFVEKFEKDFSAYLKAKYVCCVDNGTSALFLALKALNTQPGDEVIVPANSFIATAWAPAYAGAVPVFADCHKDTWNIDIDDVLSKITKKTKAIIGVHLYGQPFEISQLLRICKTYGIALIEDCAQAHGAEYHKEKIGTWGSFGCFSFYPSKNLGAYGQGGAIAVRSPKHKREIEMLRNHGAKIKYHHDIIGYNMQMDGIQGAILDTKLQYLEQRNNRRRAIAEKYRSSINNEKIKFQHCLQDTLPVYHLFVITVPDRPKLIELLENNEISYSIHYPIPCHLQKAFSYLGYKKGSLINSEYLAEHCISLPMYPELKDIEIDKITNVLNKY